MEKQKDQPQILFINQYLEKMKTIHENLLEFLEKNSNNEDDIQKILDHFETYKIRKDPILLKAILILIAKISNNHQRSKDFISKIEQLINAYKEEIKQFYSNFEIFNIFNSNKRILLFLFNEKLLVPDDNLALIIQNDKYIKKSYPAYFFNEFKQFFDQKLIQSITENNPEVNSNEEYQQQRKNGENDSFICDLIRNDSIEEFVSYVNKKNIYLSSVINPSIYETNSFLIQKRPTLIEYSMFYGAIQIFKYLQLNRVPLTSSLWLFAIHGKNAEMIHLLEYNRVKPIDNSFDQCFKESIKNHHVEITNYIANTHLKKLNESLYFSNCFKYHNFISIQKIKYADIFNQASKYDYFEIVDFLLKSSNFDKLWVYDGDGLYNIQDEYSIITCSLCNSVKKGNIDIVKLLINIPKIDFDSSLCIAVEKGYIDIVKILIAKEDLNVNEFLDYKTALHIAIEKENVKIIQLLLSRDDIDVNISETIYVKDGAEQRSDNDDDDENEYDIEDVEDEDIEIKTPLFIAIEKQNIDIIKLLLNQKNININAKSEFIHKTVETQLQKCYGRESDSEYDVYDDYDYSRRRRYQRPVYDDYDEYRMQNEFEMYDYDRFYGTYENYRNMREIQDTRELNSYYKENKIEHQDKKTKTALHLAVQLENEEIIDLLLNQKRIDINVKDDQFKTPYESTQNPKIKAMFEKVMNKV